MELDENYEAQAVPEETSERLEKKEQLRSKVQALVSCYEEEKRRNEELMMELDRLKAEQQGTQPLQPAGNHSAAPAMPNAGMPAPGGVPFGQPQQGAPGGYTLQNFGAQGQQQPGMPGQQPGMGMPGQQQQQPFGQQPGMGMPGQQQQQPFGQQPGMGMPGQQQQPFGQQPGMGMPGQQQQPFGQQPGMGMPGQQQQPFGQQPGMGMPGQQQQPFGQQPGMGMPGQQQQAFGQQPGMGMQQPFGQPSAFGQPQMGQQSDAALMENMSMVMQTITQVRAKLHQFESIRGYGYPQQPAYVDHDTVALLDKLYDQLGDLSRELMQRQNRLF